MHAGLTQSLPARWRWLPSSFSCILPPFPPVDWIGASDRTACMIKTVCYFKKTSRIDNLCAQYSSQYSDIQCSSSSRNIVANRTFLDWSWWPWRRAELRNWPPPLLWCVQERRRAGSSKGKPSRFSYLVLRRLAGGAQLLWPFRLSSKS